ncbi:MAG: hypothetical protein IPH03_03780 [Tetrasphaera sp.]|nr:hypothetical protein [Tetrasphaera sp.]
MDTAVYRIAQEALTNTVRHARRATRISIDVRRVEDRVLLRVVDDGLATEEVGLPPRVRVDRDGERPGSRWLLLGLAPGAQGGWVVEMMLPVAAPR